MAQSLDLKSRSRVGTLARMIVFATCGLLGTVSILRAADGDLDPSWNSDGMLSLSSVDTILEGRGIAVQCDGKVVVVGISEEDGEPPVGLVLRFTEYGYFDTTFGTNGVFTIARGFEGDEAWDVVVQPDGKIVVVGTRFSPLGSSNAFALRLTTAGVPDSSFGLSGYREFTFVGLPLGTSVARSVALQQDGGIVVVGTTGNPSSIGLVRLTSTGGLDSSFDGDGRITIDFQEGDDKGFDVAVLEDGRVVVAGTVVVGGGANFGVLSFLPSGAPDTRFGPAGDGQLIFDFGDQSYGRALAIQDDGKIVVAGSTDVSSSAMAVARITDQGDFDSLFSIDGMVVRDLGPGLDEGWDVAIQSDGRIIVAGSTNIDGLDHFALIRLTSGGLVDNSLGGFGYTAVNFGPDSFGRSLAIQPHDRKILLAGIIDTPLFTEDRLGVTRTIGDSELLFAGDFECGGIIAWSDAVP